MNTAATPSDPGIDSLRCVIWLMPACLGLALIYALTQWGLWLLDLVVFVYPVVVVLLGRADAKLRRCQILDQEGGQSEFKIGSHLWRFVAVQVVIGALVGSILQWLPSVGWMP